MIIAVGINRNKQRKKNWYELYVYAKAKVVADLPECIFSSSLVRLRK